MTQANTSAKHRLIDKSVLESNSRTLLLCLVPDTGYGAHRCQNRRRNRRNNLHNPLKGLFLRHNRLIDLMVNRMGESRSPRP